VGYRVGRWLDLLFFIRSRSTIAAYAALSPRRSRSSPRVLAPHAAPSLAARSMLRVRDDATPDNQARRHFGRLRDGAPVQAMRGAATLCDVDRLARTGDAAAVWWRKLAVDRGGGG